MTVVAHAAEPAPQVPADLRLLPGAVGSWLGVLAAGTVPLAACWWALGVVLAAVAWICRRSGATSRVMAVGLILCAAGMAVAATGRLSRASGPVAELARKSGIAHVELTITSDPQRLPAVPHLPPSVLIQADLRELDASGRRWATDQPVLVLAPQSSWGDLLPSTRVAASADLRLPTGTDIAAVVVVHRRPVTVRGPSSAQRWAGRVRAGLRQASHALPSSERGLLPGIVVGDTSLMPAADAKDFKLAGLTHLTAVSGANVAVVVAAVFGLLRWTRLGIRMRALTSAGVLLGFVVLARPTPSVLRAGAMGLLALAAIALGRPRALLPALLATATGMALFTPTVAARPGFAMSVLATLALLVLAPGWTAYFRARLPPRLRAFAPWLAAPLAAQVVCAPIIAAISGSVSIAAVPANLLAIPAVPIATVLGLAAAVVSVVSPGIAGALCVVAGVPCRWLIGVAHTAAHLPLATVTAPEGRWGLIFVTGMMGGLVFAIRTRGGRRTLALTAVILTTATLAGLH